MAASGGNNATADRAVQKLPARTKIAEMYFKPMVIFCTMDEMHKLGIGFFAFCLIPSVCFGSAEWECFHAPAKALSETILKETNAILSLDGARGESKLKTYKKDNSEFRVDAFIDIGETKPISSSGYHPPVTSKEMNGAKYPIIHQEGQYIQVAVNSLLGQEKKVWLNPTELPGAYQIYSFNNRKPVCCAGIYALGGLSSRELYESPQEKAPKRIISRTAVEKANKRASNPNPTNGDQCLDDYPNFDNFDGAYFKILKIEKNFALLGNLDDIWAAYDGPTDKKNKPVSKPIGWVKLRDDKGRLTIWLSQPAVD